MARILNYGNFLRDPLIFKFVRENLGYQENIPVSGSVNATGFMFENDEFYLPLNIGFLPKRLTIVIIANNEGSLPMRRTNNINLVFGGNKTLSKKLKFRPNF